MCHNDVTPMSGHDILLLTIFNHNTTSYKIILNFSALDFVSPTYNISMTRISVGEKAADLDLFAIFDSGTSFTYLSDPAYTLISESVSKPSTSYVIFPGFPCLLI